MGSFLSVRELIIIIIIIIIGAVVRHNVSIRAESEVPAVARWRGWLEG